MYAYLLIMALTVNYLTIITIFSDYSKSSINLYKSITNKVLMLLKY